MDINLAMHKLNPNYYYHCYDNNYNNLIMLDNNLKPSLLQLHDAYSDYLNSEAKALLIAKIEDLAELERLKYITKGSGKAMEYQQQREEVELYQSGTTNPNQLPIAKEMSIELNVPIADIITQWSNNIAQWKTKGARIAAKLAKMKRVVSNTTFTSQSQIDNFMINFD